MPYALHTWLGALTLANAVARTSRRRQRVRWDAEALTWRVGAA